MTTMRKKFARCAFPEGAQSWTRRSGRRPRRALQAASEVYRHRTGARAFGRPANGVESPYLLTGVGPCAVCGGSMAVMKGAHGPRGARREIPF